MVLLGYLFFGVAIWLFTLFFLPLTGCKQDTIKQLKGMIFFQEKDGWEFIYKHWQAVILTPITLFLINSSFFIFGMFCLLGKFH